jgi:hypothetical protein
MLSSSSSSIHSLHVNEQLKEINQELKQLLKVNKKEVSHQFEASLQKVSKFMEERGHALFAFSSLQDRVVYLVTFKQIKQKIITLKKRRYIKLHDCNPQKVLDKVHKTILAAESNLKRSERLPVDYGDTLKEDKKETIKKLTLRIENPNEDAYICAEKEVFHLVLDKESKDNLKSVDVNRLEGREVSSAILSVIYVLKKSLRQQSRVIRDGQFILLEELQNALRWAQKMEKCHDAPVSSGYYRALTTTAPLLTRIDQIKEELRNQQVSVSQETVLGKLSNSERQQWELFEKETKVGGKNPPIRSVLLNDICWDILDSIERMKPDDYRFIPLGTKDHCLILAVFCYELNNALFYNFYVYNTGEGVNYHLQKEKEGVEYVKPLTFLAIDKKSLTYDFFEHLVNESVFGTSIDKVYQILLNLVKERKAYQMTSLGSWHPEQGHGTCTQTALEMACFSRLIQTEIQTYEKIKAKVAFHKQKQIVNKLKQLFSQHLNGLESQRKKISTRLEQSKSILKLVENQFKLLSKEHSSSLQKTAARLNNSLCQ